MKKEPSLATGNVRTLLDFKVAERSQRQTALVAREHDRYNIDILAPQEISFEGQGSLQETFLLDKKRALDKERR